MRPLPTLVEIKAFGAGQGVTWRELARRHPWRLGLVFAAGSVAGPTVWKVVGAFLGLAKAIVGSL